jgi:DNA-directed RNA polymerase subunit RPC12/RpoP
MSDTSEPSRDDPEAYEDENAVPCRPAISTNTIQIAARGFSTSVETVTTSPTRVPDQWTSISDERNTRTPGATPTRTENGTVRESTVSGAEGDEVVCPVCDSVDIEGVADGYLDYRCLNCGATFDAGGRFRRTVGSAQATRLTRTRGERRSQ